MGKLILFVKELVFYYKNRYYRFCSGKNGYNEVD